MDHFHSLHKANPPSPGKCKRRQASQIRSQKRCELYSLTRNISPSPSSKRRHCSPRKHQDENSKPINTCEAEKPSESARSGAPSFKMNQKLTRQKAHIMKFLAWKAEKAKQAQIKEKSKRVPFVVSTRNCAATLTDLINNVGKSSFAPANHIFRPPATLQVHELEVIDSNSMRLINGTREETYHFLATPKRKPCMPEFGILPLKSYKKFMPVPRTGIVNTNSNKGIANTRAIKKNSSTATNMEEPPPKREAHPVPILLRPTMKAPKNLSPSMEVSRNVHLRQQAPTVKLNGKPVLKTLAENAKFSEQILDTVTDANQGQTFFNVVTLSKKNSLPSNDSRNGWHFAENNKLSRIVKESMTHPVDCDTKPIAVKRAAMLNLTSGKTTKVTKALINTKPNLNVNVREFCANPKINTDLSKQKSFLLPIKRSIFKAPKKSNSSVSNAFMAVSGNTHFGLGASRNKFNGKSVPKTRISVKSSEHIPEPPTIRHQGYPFLNVVTSTKRKSLSTKESGVNSFFVKMDQSVSPVDDAAAHPADKEKFNFLRYSVVQSDASITEDEVKTKVANEIHVTPDKAAGQPTTYIIPFDSVSICAEGKKIERQKSKRTYKSMASSVQEDVDATEKERQTVQYYRKQLEDEIARLKVQCDAWQQYKEDNVHLVEDTGSDMINVTIGQTKLLTTKKLKQFGDLIDRCENGAMGKKSLGKGEGAKPILMEDLEGFWSMVGLQIENVDKRFTNLQRWKENNWKDPDEVPAKLSNSNSNLKKMKKLKPGSTAGPNRDLQKILRNAQIAFLRKKTANSRLDEDVILTPSKNRQVLIKNRRSRSAAATVITVNTQKCNPKSSAFDKSIPIGTTPSKKMLPNIHCFHKNMINAIINKQEKKSPEAINCATTLPLLRKSILKTPGSIRPSKNTIFNSPTLQFTVEGKSENVSPPQSRSPSNREEEERTYSLRTRNIKLRDLADIIIPE